MDTERSVRETIRAARGNNTQSEFAVLLKTSQSLISKYESGKANPPAALIDKCNQIIHTKNNGEEVSLGFLEERMRKALRGPSQAAVRKAFAMLIDAIEELHP